MSLVQFFIKYLAMPSTFTYIAPKRIHALMKSLNRNESYNEKEHAQHANDIWPSKNIE